jgi:MOSC domain-containing protein YiiM
VNVELLHFYVSPGHNYFGHHSQPPGEHPIIELKEIRCVAGMGIEGDRFHGFKEDYRGQITFFADEVYQELCAQFGVVDREPSAFRRNVITRGVDLNSWIGLEFELQGVRFLGTGECQPCHWMNRAFHEGAERALHGRGGLRAKILSTGILRLSEPNSSA